jgi:hypothetical protein
MTVPASVPSDLKSSRPARSSSATKKSVPLTSMSCSGLEEPMEEAMSLTRTVPWGVPSVFQSSRPV